MRKLNFYKLVQTYSEIIFESPYVFYRAIRNPITLLLQLHIIVEAKTYVNRADRNFR